MSTSAKIIGTSAAPEGAAKVHQPEGLKTWNVFLTTRGSFTGTVEAKSLDDAIEQAYRLWRTECPHPFEKSDDDELMDVIAEEVQS